MAWMCWWRHRDVCLICMVSALCGEEIEMLVLDEADRMLLDMGLSNLSTRSLTVFPTDAQCLLISATLSRKVRDCKTAVNDPYEISIAANQASKAILSSGWSPSIKTWNQHYLAIWLKKINGIEALIFIETKRGAAKLVSQLKNVKSPLKHSTVVVVRKCVRAYWKDFKTARLNTSSSDGCGCARYRWELSRVVNYDLPFPTDEYVHRIGRTGRANASGEISSLYRKDNFKNLCMIETV